MQAVVPENFEFPDAEFEIFISSRTRKIINFLFTLPQIVNLR
jgi:hypothetical protein